MLIELLIALLAAIGAAACIRHLADILLYPLKGAVILIPAAGDGAELEHQMKGIHALSCEGRIEGETVLLADLGLDARGQAVAAQLCRRYPGICLCGAEDEAEDTPDRT